MHRLLTKKHRDDEQPKPQNKLRSFKRNKSQPPPTSRPQVDLTQALPPTDDFRISLMMPNLEKRFSVLREGEDQEGMGASGMGSGALASGTLFKDDQGGDFAKPTVAGLTDITEVASIRSGSRAEGSFDLPGRAAQTEDYSGSIMDRPRQGEGNALFGGRQKVFRINTAAAGSDDVEDSPLSPIGRGRIGGRALYTEDLPVQNGFRKGSTVDRESPRSQSPPPSNYNLDRNTQSSTNSGPTSLTRSSTTATSTSSNSRNFTPNTFVNTMVSTSSSKPRRLIYEQALDRDNSEREQNMLETHLENHKLAIMAQKRAGSTSPHPYSEEDERRRAMSPPVRSFARPFSPPRHEDPEPRGRLDASQSNPKPQIPSLRTSESSPALITSKHQANDVPFSFGFDESSNSPRTRAPRLETAVSNHGLPTPRPESDEYHDSQIPIAATGPTPSPSPLAEKYSTGPNISRELDFALDEPQGAQPVSRRSSVSELSQQPQRGQQSTFYEASDSEREINDGASSVYDDDEDPYVPFEQPLVNHIPASSPHKPQKHVIPAFPSEKQMLSPPGTSPTRGSHDLTPLHDSDSPTLPPNAGLSSMIRQHLRSDSGISSIYAPSMHGKISEPYPEPPSLAQTLADWNQDQYHDYDEEAPFQPDAPQVEIHEPKPTFSLADLKKKEAEENKLQVEKPAPALKSIPMERNRSDNTLSTGDDETDEWRTQLEEKKRMLQQRLQEHSGRNSPAPGFADSTEDLPKNSILKPGMLGNMLKGKSSPASTPGKEESKALKMLGISPLLNQSKESFGRREEEEEVGFDRSEDRLRPMHSRPDMHHPQSDARPRGPGPMPGQRPHPPYGQGPPGPGRPYPPHAGPGHHNQPPTNGPRSFLPMAGPSQNGPRKGAGHIPIDAGMPPASNMHREFVEQGRGGQRPGPGMPSHMQHRSPPPSRGYEQMGRPEFRPPHDRQDGRGPPPQQGGRPRTRSNAQPPPNEFMHKSPSHKGQMRQRPSEEDLRGRQRGPPPRMPGVNDMSGVMTTVTTGTAPLPLNIDKKPQSSKGKQADPVQQREPQSRTEAKAAESAARDRRPGNLAIPPTEVSQSRFSTEDSPQGSSFVGRFRSNSKSHKISSIAIFEQENSSQPSLPSPPKLPQTTPSSMSKPPLTAASGTAQTLAELTGSDGANPAFQKTGAPAASIRDGKRPKIRKQDISEPTLLHTTSQMPVSNLIDAGSKVYHRVLPPGLSDSPQVRQRSGSDESTSRIPRGTTMPLQGQRTSDPDSERTRTLRKAASDGSGLRERAASSGRHRPAMPSPMPFFGTDGRPLNAAPHPFPNNAPAGMI
ncbi:hypothetical protein TWF481_011827 [Arthrobotrys musiformis]|uniref:Uncharacterized protein n=1 Tax=Arthrobotrys musiformis TaxID=47236 RepID=A0AAV9VX88_9PEZI